MPPAGLAERPGEGPAPLRQISAELRAPEYQAKSIRFCFLNRGHRCLRGDLPSVLAKVLHLCDKNWPSYAEKRDSGTISCISRQIFAVEARDFRRGAQQVPPGTTVSSVEKAKPNRFGQYSGARNSADIHRRDAGPLQGRSVSPARGGYNLGSKSKTESIWLVFQGP